VPLTAALLRIISFVDGKADLALLCINRDLREGRLHAALVAPDGTLRLLEVSDWQSRTVHAPLIPAEGVRVEPYEEGRFFIARPDLDEWYSMSPVPATVAVDPQPAVKLPSGEKATEAETTRWAREPVIAKMKEFYPPNGIRPKGLSIAALTKRINRQPEFQGKTVSEDTVRLADFEIKAAFEAARRK
jgi:hypothetical protein